MKTIAIAFQTAWVFLLVTILWLLGVKPGDDMVFTPDDHCCNIPEDCKGCKWAETKDCIQRKVANAPTVIEAEEGKRDRH